MADRPDDIDILNDWTYRAGDNDVIFFFYPREGAITKKDLLTRFKPAPLPKPADPPPAQPPPVTPPVIELPDEYEVVWTALRVRADHSVNSKQIGLLYKGQIVGIAREGRVTDGENTWGRITHVDSSKYDGIGWVALEGLAKKA